MRYGTAVARERQRQKMVVEPPDPVEIVPVPQNIKAVGRLEVRAETVILWDHNPLKRARISDARLEASIRKYGIRLPLGVWRRTSDDQWTCIEGNRRLRIARRLGMMTVPIHEIPGASPEEAALTLNITGERWDGQTLGQYVVEFPDVLPLLPEATRRRVEYAMSVMGNSFPAYIVDNPLTAVDAAAAVARYLGRADDRRFIKKAAYWILRHKQTLKIRAAIILGMSTRVIERAIENDESLVTD